MEGHCGEVDLNPTGVIYGRDRPRIGRWLPLRAANSSGSVHIAKRRVCRNQAFGFWMLETEIVLEQVGQT